MATELTTTGATALEPISPAEQEEAVRVLILGGVEAPAAALHVSEGLRLEMDAQHLRICALHKYDPSGAAWLTQAGMQLVALAGMRGGGAEAASLFDGAQTRVIGAGPTESLANRPYLRSINGIRLGFVSYGEQRTGGFNGRADILDLMAFDQVRMLLNQCDHVIVLARAGLDEGELPLPEWRARYRRFIDVGASLVADTSMARGWEAYKSGLVFYGLGAPDSANSLGLFLTLRRNGRLSYEVRALEDTAGMLERSTNSGFKARIDAQSTLLTDNAAFEAAANAMCLRIYSESELSQKRGLLGALLPQVNEEERLLSLLESESRRFMVLRAIRLKRAAENAKRQNAKKA